MTIDNHRVPQKPSKTYYCLKKGIKMLDISRIRIDGTQSRVECSENTLAEYAEAIRSGAEFPPIVVFYDGADYWLADGFHRLLAHKRAGKDQISATVNTGSQRDAILYSAGANHAHGLRRTNADKRKAVGMMLSDSEWVTWSDNEIAKRCRVSHTFVSDVRRSLATDASEKLSERTYTTKHGTQATMQVDKIGKIDRQELQDEPEAIQNPAPARIPAEERYALTREQELENECMELALSLETTLAALNDLQNEGAEGYLSEMKKLQRNLEAVTASRDGLLFENAELKKHIKYLDRKLKNM